jgi:hypothetical protein
MPSAFSRVRLPLCKVFKRLKRKDGICVGVFPKGSRDEVRENVTLTQELTGGVGYTFPKMKAKD